LKYVKDNDKGFLLLESLMVLGMIASILLFIYPPLVQWMTLRHETKQEVEMARVFYESSIDWDDATTMTEQSQDSYQIMKNEHLLKVWNKEQSIEVKINDYEFK